MQTPTTVQKWLVLAALIYGFATAGTARADEAVPGKMGTFTTTFTQRSPLTGVKTLAARLGEKTLDGDYDPAKEPVIVYVPENYDPAKPLGLIVLLNYKDSAEPPVGVLPVLKEKNLAVAVPQGSGQPGWAKCGLAVDIVHNMGGLYKIDPARVYLFGYDQEVSAVRAGVGYSDVFAGFAVTEFYETWRPMRASNGGTYPPKLPAPPAAMVGAAKSHPAVFCHSSTSEHQDLVPKTFTADGFRRVKTLKVTLDDFHYPNYLPGWFVETVNFLDQDAGARRPKPAPAKVPATKPAPVVPAKPAPKPAPR